MIKYAWKKYGLYEFENIDENESKNQIIQAFRNQFEKKIKIALVKIGLKFVRLEYYSPTQYNFETDTIDLVIGSRIDKKKFAKAIKKYEQIIDSALYENKSYDGYHATTVCTVEAELDKLADANYEPDVLVLETILEKMVDTSGFHYEEYIIFEPEENETCLYTYRKEIEKVKA